MGRTIIELDETQVEPLRALAEKDGRSIDKLVHDALDIYVQERMDREERFARFDETLRRIRARIPPDITPEEIEADITAARDEVRAMRRVTLCHS